MWGLDTEEKGRDVAVSGCFALCGEDTDDLEWRNVPVVLLAHQLALDEM